MKIKFLEKKQIIIISISIVLVFLGYFAYLNNDNFIDNNIANQIADVSNNSERLGDVELVSTQNIYEEDIATNEAIGKDEKQTNSTETNNSKNEEVDNKKQDNYFEESRLERDKMYSETIEVYENILANDSISEDQKVIAENEIAAITNVKNGIVVAENLIKVKGFEDVVIFINDATATVVVKIDTLKKAHIAQIQNIITKQLSIEIKDISITNKYE